jgi:hypothetical protein
MPLTFISGISSPPVQQFKFQAYCKSLGKIKP